MEPSRLAGLGPDLPAVRVVGDARQVLMTVKGLQGPNGPINTKLESAGGVLAISYPPSLFPFLELGDVVPVTISLVKSFLEMVPPEPQASGLILPN